MAIVEEPLALPSGQPERSTQPLGVFTRPRETSGLMTWITTVDHKRIGIMYGASAMFFLVIGGVAALLMRIQLATPNSTFLSGDAYNRVYTMHGTVMVFLVVMPIGAAFANYMMPIQVGARDVAFPRINAFSFWVFFFGGIMLNTSWFLGGGADGGWFNYAPNNGVSFLTLDRHRLTGTIGLLIVGFGSLTGSINLITTVINLRAPGMSLMKMPVFVWMTLVTQFLLLFAIPVLTVAQLLLMFDRHLRRQLLQRAAGGRSAAVAAPVLGLRAPRGVPDDPPRVRDRLRGHSRPSPASRSSVTRSWSSPGSPSASWVGACGPTTCSCPASGRSRSPRSASRRCSSLFRQA